MKPALVFIGFMGAGKSTALAAARDAGLETTEIDELMEARARRCRSPRPSRSDGEEAFRAREAEVVGELLEGADGGAIALGGGSVLSERVREALGRHVVVWLAGRRARGLATDRPQRPPAGRQRRGRRAACSSDAGRSTKRWPTRSSRPAIAA